MKILKLKGGDNIRNGIFKADELIYSEVKEIRNNKNIDYSYPDLIVGWKIEFFWQDSNKGKIFYGRSYQFKETGRKFFSKRE